MKYENKRCIKCQQNIEYEFSESDITNLNCACDFTIQAHWGSKHDMCPGDPLLIGWICDKCITRAKESKLLQESEIKAKWQF
jgi:hypothetical protein